MEDDSELEGLYRLLGNPYVNPESLLEPHVLETMKRCQAEKVVLAVQDTTGVVCSGEVERQGMGRLSSSKREGFFVHVDLAVTSDGRALGVLGLESWVRSGPSRWKGGRKVVSGAGTETARWARMADAVEDRFAGAPTRVIHVMDREGDQYDLLTALCQKRRHFVIRLTHDRRLLDGKRLLDALSEAPVLGQRQVDVSKRNSSKKPLNERKQNPSRAARTANLTIRAAAVELRRPQVSKSVEGSLVVNVVRALEESPPAGEDPIEWLLVTSEPVAKVAEALKVVDYYRCRWVIEEYFKALKTGCALEKRQLESYFSYVRALALLVPVAWALLHLRDIARRQPAAPATAVLSGEQLRVLKAYKPGLLPASPTAEQALLAVAKIGGHLKNNGPPGWMVLGRGYEKLRNLEEGWAARDRATATRQRTSDR